jgi:hypothetical protein
MGRIRHGRASAVGAVSLVICLLALAGCGDDSSTSASDATVPQITTPSGVNSSRGSTTTPPATQGNPQANPNGHSNGSPGVQSLQEALGPFRDCLTHHGVSLGLLNGVGGAQRQQNPEQYRGQVEKAFACIPELPPQLRERAEQLKRRFEQRYG